MDFPSEPWTGFYNYGRSPRKHRMDFVLIFADHTVLGGFHIWPLGQGEGEQNYKSAEEPAPVEAVVVET